MEDANRIISVSAKLASIGKEDRIKALLAVEEDLGNVTVVCKYKWNSFLYSKMPTSLLPKTEVNAEMINEVLVKSWETQGSVCPLSFEPEAVLLTSERFCIDGLLMYYFKCLNVAENMKRVVGLKGGQTWHVHSFLKVGEHIIDNAFNEEKTNWMQEDPSRFRHELSLEYCDVDPADPEYTVYPTFVGLKNERLVNGKDEKAEQNFVMDLGNIPTLPMMLVDVNMYLYDINMRKFIKEKYGVEIENLFNKWIKLCWNCFATAQELKMCSKCRVARYCGKNCQAQDWKVHKILHKLHVRD